MTNSGRTRAQVLRNVVENMEQHRQALADAFVLRTRLLVAGLKIASSVPSLFSRAQFERLTVLTVEKKPPSRIFPSDCKAKLLT